MVLPYLRHNLPERKIDVVIQLHSMTCKDLEYLYSLCEVTMRTYTEKVWGSWNELEVRKHFTSALAEGKYEGIFKGGTRIGAISVERHQNFFQLDQIYIEPSYQNRGFGEIVVRKLIAKAEKDKLPIRLRVLKPNPAKLFYEKLGFAVYESTEERFSMEYAVHNKGV